MQFHMNGGLNVVYFWDLLIYGVDRSLGARFYRDRFHAQTNDGDLHSIKLISMWRDWLIHHIPSIKESIKGAVLARALDQQVNTRPRKKPKNDDRLFGAPRSRSTGS